MHLRACGSLCLVLAAAIALTGCAADPLPASAGAPAAAASPDSYLEPAPVEPVYEPDHQAYLAAMATNIAILGPGNISAPSNAVLENWGTAMCAQADNNVSMHDDQQAALDTDPSGKAVMFTTSLAMAAVRNLCPSNAAWLATEYPLSEPTAYQGALDSLLGTNVAPAPQPDQNNDGNGYEVTCMDGTTSYSGGIQGACSHHGGVSG